LLACSRRFYSRTRHVLPAVAKRRSLLRKRTFCCVGRVLAAFTVHAHGPTASRIPYSRDVTGFAATAFAEVRWASDPMAYDDGRPASALIGRAPRRVGAASCTRSRTSRRS